MKFNVGGDPFYNAKRPHSSLGARTPDQAYFDAMPPLARAA